ALVLIASLLSFLPLRQVSHSAGRRCRRIPHANPVPVGTSPADPTRLRLTTSSINTYAVRTSKVVGRVGRKTWTLPTKSTAPGRFRPRRGRIRFRSSGHGDVDLPRLRLSPLRQGDLENPVAVVVL